MTDDRPTATGETLTEDGRYRLLIQAVTDFAIYMLDADGIVISWNAGARRFKGYEAGEIIGQHFSRFYTPEDRAAGLPARALGIAASEGKFEQEGWRVRKDGSRMWAHIVIDPIRDASGTIIGYAKITRDLGERRQAEATLRRSEDQFRRLVQSVTDYAIYMLDPGGRVASWNVGAERIKGYRADEIIGQHFSRFYTPEDRQAGEPERTLRIATETGRFEKEGWRVRKDGTRFLANVVVDAIHDDDGTLAGFAKVTRNVTEQREAQRALDLAREALLQSRKMEAIGQLTGGIAHDFNNILMAVLSGMELLRKRLEHDPRGLKLLDNSVAAAQRGAALTQRMLAFARRQDLAQDEVALPTLIEGMLPLLRQSLGAGIAVETRFEPGLGAVRIDANQLEMALLNLAVNARDAMCGDGRLLIAAAPLDPASARQAGLAEAPYVRLSMIDTGEGMDDEVLSRARDPFFTTKGIGKGTGLGLSMVHGLAEQSGGRLVLASRKGEGTTAELWLPVAAEAPAEAAPPQAIEPADGQSLDRSLVVLVVDDDPIVLRNTAAMLEDLGHTVLEAGSGREALSLIRRARPLDLVITDQAMPEMTGVQLAEALKADAPQLPVILATGYAELDPGAGLQLPRLAKPFRQAELARRIASVAGRGA